MRCRTRIVSTGFATRLALVAHQPGRVMSLYLARGAAGIEPAMRKPHGIGAFATHTPSRPECLRAYSPDQDLPCTTLLGGRLGWALQVQGLRRDTEAQLGVPRRASPAAAPKASRFETTTRVVIEGDGSRHSSALAPDLTPAVVPRAREFFHADPTT